MKIKPQLLEYLIRACVNEVLNQVNEDDEFKGAPAPPADGQGTAEQPELPKEKEAEVEPNPEDKETPEMPSEDELKGLLFLTPSDKSKLQKMTLKAQDDATIERALFAFASKNAGPRIKIALSTIRAVREVVKNPNIPLYLYLGKNDPDSDDIFLLADRSLAVAKDSAATPEEISGTEASRYKLNDPYGSGVEPEDLATSYAKNSPGYSDKSRSEPNTDSPDIDENIKSLIKKMVNELLDTK